MTFWTRFIPGGSGPLPMSSSRVLLPSAIASVPVTAYLLGKNDKNASISHQKRNYSNHIVQNDEPYKPKVIIVGGGLTGAATAYMTRKRFGKNVEISLIESSPYPAGRFASGLRYGIGKWADMGAQVLSVVDTTVATDNRMSSKSGLENFILSFLLK